MKIEELSVGLKVKHPVYGIGQVAAVTKHEAQIEFLDGIKSLEPESAGLEPAAPCPAQAGTDAEKMEKIIARAVENAMEKHLTGDVPELVRRWQGGKLEMKPADPAQQGKEIEIEAFFHKIVMMRNNLRVLEQKINSHPKLAETEKAELQGYITRCYGSMTTFNLLFKDKDDQFHSKAGQDEA